MKVPMTIIRVEDLRAKKDVKYSEGPACNVCNGAQTQLTYNQSQELWMHPDLETLQLYK
jgi:hypothetical protein